VCGSISHVYFAAESGHLGWQIECPLSANSGHSQDDLRNRKTAARRPLPKSDQVFCERCDRARKRLRRCIGPRTRADYACAIRSRLALPKHPPPDWPRNVLCTSSQTCRGKNCEDKKYGCYSHKQCRKVGREHDGLRLIANVQRRSKVAGR